MAKDKNVTGEEILDVCSAYMSADDLKLVEKAWHYATDAHSEQFRQVNYLIASANPPYSSGRYFGRSPS